MSVVYLDSHYMGGNPASVELNTGVFSINRDMWPHLSDVQKQLILLHELAHVYLNDHLDEENSDRLALQWYAGTCKQSLRKALDAYEDLLGKDYFDADRKMQIYKTLLSIDAGRFGNERAAQILSVIEDERRANWAQALIAAIPAVISLGTQLFGKRSAWAKGGHKKKTDARLEILSSGTLAVLQKWAKETNNAQTVKDRAMDRAFLQESVYILMGESGVFDDDSAITRDWSTKGADKFFKHYGWAREEINGFADQHLPSVTSGLGGSSGFNFNMKSVVKWGVLALIGGIVVKKVIF